MDNVRMTYKFVCFSNDRNFIRVHPIFAYIADITVPIHNNRICIPIGVCVRKRESVCEKVRVCVRKRESVYMRDCVCVRECLCESK